MPKGFKMMENKNKIGIVSCDKWIYKIKEDIEIMNALKKKGFFVDIISWEDKYIDYSNYKFLILKSVWGYHRKFTRFNSWLNMIDDLNIELLNAVAVVKENIDKSIQFNTLENNGIKTIPTVFIKDIFKIKEIYFSNSIFKEKSKIVLKPIVSGSGENTKIVEQNNFTIKELTKLYTKHFYKIKNRKGIMIQPYMKEIESGEYSIIFIDNEISHFMKRFPGVLTDEKKVLQISELPADVLELSIKVATIPEYLNCLYLRVDLIKTKLGALVMEVEAADPDLLTRNVIDDEKRKTIFENIASKIENRVVTSENNFHR